MPRRIIRIAFILLMTTATFFGCAPKTDTEAEKEAINEIEDQVKEGIWEIYTALWEYKVDHHGPYPEVIYGGDKEGWDYYNANLPEGKEPLTDPLLEGGYLRAYPFNPFVRSNPKYEKAGLITYRKGVEGFQKILASGPFDPRFGSRGDRMGNAMFAPYIFVGPGTPDKPKHLRMCPGQFFYRTYGEYKIPEKQHFTKEDSPLNYKPDKHPAHMIGAFGALDTEGGDVIRWTDMNGYVPPEFPYTYEDQYYIPHLDVGEIYVPLRVPEVYGGGYKSLLPTYPPWDEDGKIIAGAQDGFRDGVFFVVDYSGRVVVDKKDVKKEKEEEWMKWSDEGRREEEGDEEDEEGEKEGGETPEPMPKPS